MSSCLKNSQFGTNILLDSSHFREIRLWRVHTLELSVFGEFTLRIIFCFEEFTLGNAPIMESSRFVRIKHCRVCSWEISDFHYFTLGKFLTVNRWDFGELLSLDRRDQ